jgi:Periplasmic copper-binding protein (NosD)
VQESRSGWQGSRLALNVIGGSNASALNLIEYNGSNGIGSGSFGNTIQYDFICLNGTNGVWFAGGWGNSAVDCTIEANQAWGILDQGSANYFAYNTMYNNLDGNVGY